MQHHKRNRNKTCLPTAQQEKPTQDNRNHRTPQQDTRWQADLARPSQPGPSHHQDPRPPHRQPQTSRVVLQCYGWQKKNQDRGVIPIVQFVQFDENTSIQSFSPSLKFETNVTIRQYRCLCCLHVVQTMGSRMQCIHRHPIAMLSTEQAPCQGGLGNGDENNSTQTERRLKGFTKITETTACRWRRRRLNDRASQVLVASC